MSFLLRTATKSLRTRSKTLPSTYNLVAKVTRSEEQITSKQFQWRHQNSGSNSSGESNSSSNTAIHKRLYSLQTLGGVIAGYMLFECKDNHQNIKIVELKEQVTSSPTTTTTSNDVKNEDSTERKSRIGKNSVADEGNMHDMDSPWSKKPEHPSMFTRSTERPFNGESPISLLAENEYTPKEIFSIRNYLPVPVVDAATYELEIEVETPKKSAKKYTKISKLNQIKRLPEDTQGIMSGGNKCSEIVEAKLFEDLPWRAGAVENIQKLM